MPGLRIREADGLVAADLPGFPVRRQEHPGGDQRSSHCSRVRWAAPRWFRVFHRRLPPIVIEGRPAASASCAISSRLV